MNLVITGTRAYGPARPDSDLDIVMKLDQAEHFLHLLKTLDIPTYSSSDIKNPEYEGFSFSISGRLPRVQVIVAFSDEELQSWKYATDMLKEMDPISDRERRISLHTSLRDEFIKNKMHEEIVPFDYCYDDYIPF